MNNQTVLITGSSSGFGLLTAKTLLNRGYTIFATMRDLAGRNSTKAEELRKHAESKESKIHLLELDVTDEASIEKAVRKAEELEGHIDVVVNNAGYGVLGFAEAITIKQWQKQFDVNVYGVQRINRAVLPGMRKRGKGLLVHISSGMGRIVIPYAAAYTASKFALESIAESYRYELAGTGVDSVLIQPGGFNTDFFGNTEQPADAECVQSYGDRAQIPDRMWQNIDQMLAAEDSPSPQFVADAILQIIETPAGKRPLRTVVDPLMGGEGPSAINSVSAEVQKGLLTSLGQADSLQVAV